MKRKSVIQLFMGHWVMLIFVLSILPKHYLHDVFSKHTHVYTAIPANGEQYFAKAGVICDCLDLVVSSPYTPVEGISLPVAVCNYVVKHSALENHFHELPRYFFSLQGPPATA